MCTVMNNLPPMTLFDYKISNRENLMLKAFLPYIDKDFQPFLATYIKYTELLATIELFSHKDFVFDNCNSNSFSDIISSLLPYVSEKERETFEMIGNIKNIMETMEQYKDLFACNEEDSGSSAQSDNTESSVSSMLGSLLTPEQQMMFEQLSTLMNSGSKAE